MELSGVFEVQPAGIAAFIAVLIEHGQAGRRSGANGDVGRGPLLPPAANGGFIRGGGAEAILGARVLTDTPAVPATGTAGRGWRVTREDRPAPSGISERGIEQYRWRYWRAVLGSVGCLWKLMRRCVIIRHGKAFMSRAHRDMLVASV